ncbi:hypothetical protein [Thiocapsa bogorovii]|uniref:hypothetical protein n=1 Tax=Thiocapsa bogorovii TaxID=521689 RepID=UPI001E52A902|nr:hypothetical protein [Thiocapsa bogorovii]UHD17108.1 hypothetical protein LT988_03355 [Thiocapsa bogorovii]
MLVAAVLETLGVGRIIPFLALGSETDMGGRYTIAESRPGTIGNPDRKPPIVFGMLGMLGSLALKSAFVVFTVRQRSAFVADTQAAPSRRLLRAYLLQPATFHFRRNSAQLIRNMRMESNQFTSGLNSLLAFLLPGDRRDPLSICHQAADSSLGQGAPLSSRPEHPASVASIGSRRRITVAGSHRRTRKTARPVVVFGPTKGCTDGRGVLPA